MCKKFEKISKEIEWEDGDYIYCPDLNKVIIYNFIYTNVAEMGNFVVKLFRQDQLQKMVKGEKNDTLCKIYALYDFLSMDNSKQRCFYGIRSMEQLWLAFVMKEKFNKMWDGGKWISQ